MIIFNEKEYVEKNYFKKDFCIRTSDELNMIIRYYIFHGKNISEIQQILKRTKHTKTIDAYIEDDYIFTGVFMRANSKTLRVADPVWITKYEYNFVKQVNDVEKEKILFTLLVLRKVLGFEYCYLTLKDIKTLSMTQKAQKTLHKAIGELIQEGFISVFQGKKYRVNVDRINVIKSENYICVDDFERITVPYLKTLKTGEYFFCENCGRKTLYSNDDIKSHKKRKYCLKCSAKKKNGIKK